LGAVSPHGPATWLTVLAVVEEKISPIRCRGAIAWALAALATGSFCGWLSLGRAPDSDFASVTDFLDSYAAIEPGMPASQLSAVGLDPVSTTVEKLSYASLLDRIVPQDTSSADGLDEAVLDCVQAQSRCSAIVFSIPGKDPNGSGVLGFIGLSAANAEANDTPVITVLVKDGRVAFKMLSQRFPVHLAEPAAPATAAAVPLAAVLRRED
jgi:hypothetical protein